METDVDNQFSEFHLRIRGENGEVEQKVVEIPSDHDEDNLTYYWSNLTYGVDYDVTVKGVSGRMESEWDFVDTIETAPAPLTIEIDDITMDRIDVSASPTSQSNFSHVILRYNIVNGTPANEEEMKLMRTSDADVIYFFRLGALWSTKYDIVVYSVSKSGLEGEKTRVEVKSDDLPPAETILGNVTSQYSVDVTIKDDVTEDEDDWEYMIQLFGEKNELDIRNKTANDTNNRSATLKIWSLVRCTES